MLGELLGGIDPAILGEPVLLLALVFLCVVFGLLYPRSTMQRAWKDLDDAHAENKELRGTLEQQAGLIEKVVDQVGDMKVTSQATLYAMQEIQAAGRHAAGMDPLPRTQLQQIADKKE